MRLIKLKIKNIASLKGEQLIDFGSIQHQSPLFAITGETGAGKSSILNSIGLVLYGKVYKSGVTQNDLVTLGEKEGQIELIFQAKGKNYLAFWRAKVRKQNGELYSTPQTPQRELYTLEGEDFDSPKSILTTRTEELLNLDFDQFCKCIILNQGEFARFLSSSFSERKEILEKLYPGEMLESLSRELKSELDTLQKQKNELDIELATLQGDGPQGEDLIALKEKLEKNYQLHESWLNHLEQTSLHFSSLSTYQQKFVETTTRIQSVKGALAQETSVSNELLTLTQKASEELLLVQKEQEAQLPGLQELLKSEESLKHLSQQKVETHSSRERMAGQSKNWEAKLTQALVKIQDWNHKNTELKNAFCLPLEELQTHAPKLESLFDFYTQKELITQELTSKEERLQQLEIQGKEEARELKELTLKKTSIEEDKKQLITLEARKKEIQGLQDQRQRAQIRHEELTQKMQQLTSEKDELTKKSILYAQEFKQLQQEYLPLETTIKLQSLLSAVEVCLTHPTLEESKACPVCKSELNEVHIQGLKANLQKTDFTQVKLREAELARALLKKESDLVQLKELEARLLQDELQKMKEIEELKNILNSPLLELKEIETQLEEAKKKVWEQEQLLKDEERLSQMLAKSREQYLILKNDLAARSKLKLELEEKLQQLISPMSFIQELTGPVVSELKAEGRKLKTYLDHEVLGEKLIQEKIHLEENLSEARLQVTKLEATLSELTSKVAALAGVLEKELKGKKASELIATLHQRVKEKSDQLSLKERELKAQELKLKEAQSRLYTLEELIKDIDLQFTKELHLLTELGKVQLPSMSEELTTLTSKLSGLALELNSPTALFVALKELIDSQKALFKEKTSELKMSFAEVRARLEDWEKRQDRIALLTLKAQDLITHLERRARLYEVLGKDELRTFVLSLVEENLITQTNDELQKLCQGRYEIVHQSRRMKLTPEFYILDKFREGGLRKVSTLSGGETFMVSLAMALGLAEMTRGKAEIDSLFIDEGFGTLDQESLEDVLDMLKQIQNRGLMVGIISHVKALTSALPVNLLVSKKQDGTSSVGIQYN